MRIDLIESLLNRDTSFDSSSKIDFLFDEFAGELTRLELIPPGIDNINLIVRVFFIFGDTGGFEDSTIDVVEDIPVDVPNILPTHPALHGISTSFLLIMISDPILMILLLPEIVTRFTIREYALKSNPQDFFHHIGASKLSAVSSEKPMLIHGNNTPILGVRIPISIPLDKALFPDCDVSCSLVIPSFTQVHIPQLAFLESISLIFS
ncbi:hypothetical protein Tco_0659962 [Tanacetum coccineum]